MIAAICLAYASSAGAHLHTEEIAVFGTFARITVLEDNASEADKKRIHATLNTAFKQLETWHWQLHPWADGEVKTINTAIANGQTDIALSPDVEDCITHSTELYTLSHGLFNPAIGKLVQLYGFHARQAEPAPPSQDAIAALVAQHPTMTDLHIQNHRLSSDNRAVQLDWGGYAKGWALDKIAVTLRAGGIQNALINIGGNILATGHAQDNKPWRVQLYSPFDEHPALFVNLQDGDAIGTSGNYRKTYSVGPTRFCHLINPNTGQSVCSVASVTVLIPKGPRAGALSDALSKPLFITAAAQWQALAKEMGVRYALRIDAQGHIEATPALKERLETEVQSHPIGNE